MIEVVCFFQLLFKEPVLNRGERRGAGRVRGLWPVGLLGGDPRQLRDGLVLKELFGRDAQSGLAGACDDLNAENRVPAEFKEIVVDADGVET